MSSLILKYSEELQKDTNIDELNLSQAAYVLPAIKHKWVARLIVAKSQIRSLEKKKVSLQEEFFEKAKNSSSANNLKLSSIAIERSVLNDTNFKNFINKIDEEIEDTRLLVLYLEKVEVIFKNMTYDIKNIIDLNRLETT